MPKNLPRPTDAELQILQSLWTHGPSTVRQVHERLGLPTGYTTVLKLLQIMAEKGLVTRDVSTRTHVYAAAQPAQRTQRQLLQNLLDKAFAGSAASLVLQALAARRASPQELRQIRALLDSFEKGHRP
jgi:predicted transcriptional regulator